MDCKSSVTSATTFLVAGEKVGQVKLGAAQKLGVEILSEDQFRESGA
jgi:NAD-dependent DNA ligase